jgi:hypothetical protein
MAARKLSKLRKPKACLLIIWIVASRASLAELVIRGVKWDRLGFA